MLHHLLLSPPGYRSVPSSSIYHVVFRVSLTLSAQITLSFFPRSQNITTNVHIPSFVHKVLSLIGETVVVPKHLKKRERERDECLQRSSNYFLSLLCTSSLTAHVFCSFLLY